MSRISTRENANPNSGFMHTNCKQEPVSASLSTEIAHKYTVKNRQTFHFHQNYPTKSRAVFPNGCLKTSPVVFQSGECETNPEPLIMSASFDRNKGVSRKKTLIMSGLGSLRSAKTILCSLPPHLPSIRSRLARTQDATMQSESSERSDLITSGQIPGRIDIRPVLRYQYLAGGSL